MDSAHAPFEASVSPMARTLDKVLKAEHPSTLLVLISLQNQEIGNYHSRIHLIDNASGAYISKEVQDFGSKLGQYALSHPSSQPSSSRPPCRALLHQPRVRFPR